MKIFGIKNCDKVRKTLKWFRDQDIPFEYHDYRIDGFNQELLDTFLTHFQLEELFNKRSTSWRQLSDDQKNSLSSDTLLENPTLIPRPLVINSETATLGYHPDKWSDE